MKLDFIAYHKLQAQAAESVFDNLKLTHACRWLMGPFNATQCGDVAILVDHRGFHNIKKSRLGYKYLFHLSHDIADVDVYKNENLHDFDIIFVPTAAHYKSCLDSGYKENQIRLVGWPKYDVIASQIKAKQALMSISDPAQMTILYAPTFASNYEWKKLFPFFSKIGCKIIIKNHIYVDDGQVLPPGQEEEYLKALASVDEMEKNALEYGFSIVRRDENICNFFNQVDVLLSDSSSCLIEFLPFGVSVATGGGPMPGALEYLPEVALLSEDVWLCPADKLKQINPETFLDLIRAYSLGKKGLGFNVNLGCSAGAAISTQIVEYIENNPPNYPSFIYNFIALLKVLKRKTGF